MSDKDHKPEPGKGLCSGKGAMAGKVLAVTVLVAFITLSIIFWHGLKVKFLDGIMWVSHLGFFWGSVVLISTNVVGALLCAPCLPFTLAAGFLYGFLYGTVVVTISTTIAALVAFITARYFARDCVAQHWGSSARFRALDNAIKSDGFRIVFLIRSSPAHPYGVCNYLFGLTSVTLWDYGVAGFLAMLPATFVEVYIGTAVKSVAELIHGSAEESLTERIFFWAGLIVTLFSIIYTSRWLKKKLDSELIAYEEVDVDPSEEDELDGSADLDDVEAGNVVQSALHDDSHITARSLSMSPKQVLSSPEDGFAPRHREGFAALLGSEGSINAPLAADQPVNSAVNERFLVSGSRRSFVIHKRDSPQRVHAEANGRVRTVSSGSEADVFLNTDRILSAIGSA